MPEITQPKGEFTVVIRAVGENKIEDIREVRTLTRLVAEGSEGSRRGCAKKVKKGVAKDETETIKAALEKVGAQVFLARFPSPCWLDVPVPKLGELRRNVGFAMRVPSHSQFG